ncbi:MAG TPA: acyltransferase [Pyrinomonadaceae bacterium]|nr:acyltransferase [Pyrinomonadaceae bacterium]
MIDSELDIPNQISGVSHTRNIDIHSMPWWRKSELFWGIIRAAVFYQKAGFKRFPIIHRGVRVLGGNGTIQIGHLSEIHERVVLAASAAPNQPEARLTIGDYTSIWYGTVISARHEINIGQHCAISWNCTIIDNDMHQIVYSDPLHQTEVNPAVKIGDHVWIGASAIVLKGVTIGDNSVVAAGAIVTRDVPKNTLVMGTPARPVRTISGWR